EVEQRRVDVHVVQRECEREHPTAARVLRGDDDRAMPELALPAQHLRNAIGVVAVCRAEVAAEDSLNLRDAPRLEIRVEDVDESDGHGRSWTGAGVSCSRIKKLAAAIGLAVRLPSASVVRADELRDLVRPRFSVGFAKLDEAAEV